MICLFTQAFRAGITKGANMSNLGKRVSALESHLMPKGRTYVIWAMTDECMPMTEKQIDAAIERARADGAPANARFWPVRRLAPQE